MSVGKGLDPVAIAKAHPNYARNHMGKVMCSLCNVVCTDEPHFLAHIEGKRHSTELQSRVLRDVKLKRQLQEEEEYQAAKARAESLKSSDRLLKTSGGRVTLAPHGKPTHSFRTDTDLEKQQCKVWLDFYFGVVAEETRPLHRWRSAREVSDDPTDDMIYLIVACEGYESVAMKFPKVPRTTEADIDSGAYRAHWDPTRKVYSLYFIIGANLTGG